MKSIEKLSEELASDLVQLYAKYRDQGMPGTMFLGIVEDLKTRLVAQKMLRAMRSSDNGDEKSRPMSRDFVV